MSALSKIVVTVNSNGSKNVFESELESITVGRSKKADLRLAVEGMSREHFKLEHKNGELHLLDLGSANGTMINGVGVSANVSKKINPQDQIEIKGLGLKIEARILQLKPSVPKPAEPPAKPKLTEKFIKRASAPENLDSHELALSRAILIESDAEVETNKIAESHKNKEIIEKKILEEAQLKAEQLVQAAQAHAEAIKTRVEQEALEKRSELEAAWRKEYAVKFKEESEQYLIKYKDDLKDKYSQQSEMKARELAEALSEEKAQILAPELARKIAAEMAEKLAQELALDYCKEYAKKIDGEKEVEFREKHEREKKQLEQMIALHKEDAELEIERHLQLAKIEAAKIKNEAEALVHKMQEEEQKKIHHQKEESYKEALTLKSQAMKEFEKAREKAFLLHQQVLEKASLESDKIIKEARLEVQKLEDWRKKEKQNFEDLGDQAFKEAKNKSLDLINEAKEEAAKILNEANLHRSNLKEEADKLLKNAYATALAMATATDQYQLPPEVPELQTLEFSNIENLHFKGLENLKIHKKTNSEELALILQKKSLAIEEEERSLRKNMFERIILEAQEESLKIKQAAEKSAEEILAQAYVLSKRLSAETQHKYVADKERIALEIKNLIERETEAKTRLLELKDIITKGDFKKKQLESEIETLGLTQNKFKAQLEQTHQAFDLAKNELQEFLNHKKAEEENIRNKIQDTREHKIALESEYLSDKKNHEFELANINEQVASLRNEKEVLDRNLAQANEELAHARGESSKHEQLLYEFKEQIRDLEEKTSLSEQNFRQISEQEASCKLQLEVVQQELTNLIGQKDSIQGEYDNIIKNAQSLAKSQLDECLIQTQSIRKEAEEILIRNIAEIKKAQGEFEKFKAEKVANLEKENALAQKKLLDESRKLAEKEKLELVKEGQDLKSQMLVKVQEMQSKIEKTNREMDQKEKEIKDYEDKKMVEIEQKIIAMTEMAQKQIEEAKESAEKEAHRHMDETKNKRDFILADARKESESLLRNMDQEKQKLIMSLQSEMNQKKAHLEQEMAQFKNNQEREIASIKIREIETLKQKEKEFIKRWDNIRNEAVQVIAETLRINVTTKLGTSIPEELKTSFIAQLKSMVESAIYPPTEDNPKKAQAVLVGSGKVASSVKLFWIKAGLGVFIPLVLLIIYFAMPGFYSGLYDKTFGAFIGSEKATDTAILKQLEAARNRPKYQPVMTDVFKEDYLQNFVYTIGYRDTVLEQNFIESWTRDCNKFITGKLRLSDEVIVSLVSHENNMHEKFHEIFIKINPDFEKEGLARLTEVQDEYFPKIKSLFPDEDKFQQFYQFKKDYFINAYNQKKMAPSPASN